VSFEEKITWVNALVTIVVAGWYTANVVPRVASVPVSEIAYQRPILVAVGVMVVLTIAGAIVTAIGTAIAAEVTGHGSVDDIDRKDERDVRIAQRGDLAGYYVSSALMIGVLALTLMEAEHFWIANALFGALLAGGLASATAKLVAYRRGF
jgi:hypothetical protein